MYGIFTYHKNQPNVSEYAIHGSSGYVMSSAILHVFYSTHPENLFPTARDFEFHYPMDVLIPVCSPFELICGNWESN